MLFMIQGCFLCYLQFKGTFLKMTLLSTVWVKNYLNKKLTKVNQNILFIMCIDSATSALKKWEKIRHVYVDINEEEISHYSPSSIDSEYRHIMEKVHDGHISNSSMSIPNSYLLKPLPKLHLFINSVITQKNYSHI